MKGALKITGDTRTIGLHRFVGAEEAKLQELARTTRIVPMAMEVISAWGFKSIRDRPQLKDPRWKASSYTHTARIQIICTYKTHCDSHME